MGRKNIKTARIRMTNKSCAYFPCHKGLEDCTFCYCPFYPCLNDALGEYIFAQKTNQYIWSCKNCVWIHKKNVVGNILKSIKSGKVNPYRNNPGLETKGVGIIVLAHGSRLKKTNLAMNKLIRQIKNNSGLEIIEPSYLQLSSPDLKTSVKTVVEKGCKKIVIVPFFLFAGNHVARDIPSQIGREKKLYKDVEFVYAKNIGYDYRIAKITLDCIKGALKGP